jgi:MoxR-like ATPase
MTDKSYRNSTEILQLHGQPVYMSDVVDACLIGRLNLFLQGDTGIGKTQLAEDARSYFGDKSIRLLGRNDMDTRELFQQINLDKLRNAHSSEEVRELTDRIHYNLIVVDELPNCVPVVRAQLFNLFDGFIELNGVFYPIGDGYSVGIATGNIGQQFTESSNDLGRALRDRMHVTIDTDYFFPKPFDTLEILARNTNPRVEFKQQQGEQRNDIIGKHNALTTKEIPIEKLVFANYLLHGLDYCDKGSKRKMKDAWPTQLENHEQASDVGLVLPISLRGAKSVLRLSQALDEIVRQKGGNAETIEKGYFDSMMQSYKLVGSYSGILNEAAVRNVYGGDNYEALQAVIETTKQQFDQQGDNILAGFAMVNSGKTDQRVLNLYQGRWLFLRNLFEGMVAQNRSEENK